MMLPPTPPSATRLERLLGYLQDDSRNLKLRKDAILEAIITSQWDKARELIDDGLWIDGNETDFLALSALAYLHAQQFEEAERALLAAFAHGVDTPELRYNIAFADFMQQRYEDAIEWLSRPEEGPALPLALTLRARCFYHLSRPLEAIADCRSRLKLSPDDAETLGLMGLLLYEQHEMNDASEAIERALRLNACQLEAMLARASIQSDVQDDEAAESSYRQLLQAHPQCGRGWLGLALIKLRQMQDVEARHAVEMAAGLLPDHIGTWHILAWTQIMQGDIPAAELSFERALALNTAFAESHGGLAVVAALQGREADARAGIRRALRLHSQSLSARYAELLLLKRSGRDEEARALVEDVLQAPMPHSDMRYRDLVAAHMKYLDSRPPLPSAEVVLH